MKRMPIAILLVALFITLCSCGKSDMQKGKEELKAQNYDEALAHFNAAQIDDPNNEQIDTLIQMTKEQKANSMLQSNLSTYDSNVTSHIERVKQLLDGLDENSLSVEILSDAKNSLQIETDYLTQQYLPGEFHVLEDPNRYVQSLLKDANDVIEGGYDILDYDKQAQTKKPMGYNLSHAKFISSREIFQENYDKFTNIMNQLKREHE